MVIFGKSAGAWRRAVAAGCLMLASAGGLAEGSRTLIPGGQLVGVAVASRGLIYVGASDLGAKPSPARKAGLKMGDVIATANGRELTGAQALAGMLMGGGEVELGVYRGEERLTFKLSPERDPRDGAWRIGAWVRESTAGVGTLTFIDPYTGEYGALGHAIADPDTQTVVRVREGYIYESDAAGVIPGKRGSPGELAGDFVDRNRVIGTITSNTEAGIGGTYLKARAGSELFPEGLEAAGAGDVRPGYAQLIATVDEGGPSLFDMEIISVNEAAGTRNLALRITDKALLDVTGGIVQGMSGAPIVQGGKLAGAITHVLVNDPARGYGITIGNMLDAARSDARKAA